MKNSLQRSRYLVAMLCGVMLLDLFFIPQVHALPAVDWRFPAFPQRTIFYVPEVARTNVLLKVNCGDDSPVRAGRFLACGPDGSLLPLRVISAQGDEVVLALEAPRFGGRPCAVYYGGSSSNEPVSAPAAAVDQTPLAFGFNSLAGRAVPTSWERLKLMLKTPPAQFRTPYRLAEFNDVASEMDRIENEKADKAEKEAKDKGKKVETRRPRSGVKLALVRSYLHCTLAGTYRFAVNCRDAGFVVVNGELAAAWPGEHKPGAWQLGSPINLKAGVHRVEVFNAFDGGKPELRVGWLRPDRKDIIPLRAPDLVASCEVMETRDERINRSLQPGFVVQPGKAYSFRGDSAEYVSVQFNNITENWISTNLESRWHFGDGTQSVEKNPVHVFGAADVFKTSLEVRDKLGFVAGCSESVDCREIQAEEYAVSCELTGLPAVCLGRDKVAPVLRIQGIVPTNIAYDVSWEWQFRSGATGQTQQVVMPGSLMQFMALPPMCADELVSLRWQVYHRQSRLGGEQIRFVKPPFDVLPERVEGDRLYTAGGARLVLVPDGGSAAFRQTGPAPGPKLGRLVCVDDSLGVKGLVKPGTDSFATVLARLLKGRVDDVGYAALPAWVEFPESYGPLRKLVDVPAVLRRERADIAVLSIGLQDIMEVRDESLFERQAAALSDLVMTLMNLRVVWVTPPPYASAPERSREFASAIRRVAEARNIPVADLYTVFNCISDSRHVFFEDNPLMISAQGHRLVGQQIVRALMGE